ncbi:MAG TPA: hypothetical protein VGN57_10185 [Pirellulaceae bacterium]|nr:hypothetical protein [Pirellulaceae bacterium]
MTASAAYEREYRQWVARSSFAALHARASQNLDAAVQAKRPDLVASALDGLSVCYHYRGAVTLLEGDDFGWRDVQCGYLANVYALRLRIPLMTPMGSTRREDPNFVVRTTVLLGLARLFRIPLDERLIREWLAPRFDAEKLAGDVPAGRLILATLFGLEGPVAADALRRDRGACIKAQDAWPKRPTETAPLGVLDVEMSLAHPAEATFSFDEIAYAPTEDDAVILAMTAYHEWND